MTSDIFLIAAALAAGLMNSVAGGGSFLTFPALVFTGVPSIIANATSTVALFPGVLASAWAYRKEIEALDIPDRKSTRLNSSHLVISYAVFCLKKKKKHNDLHCVDCFNHRHVMN